MENTRPRSGCVLDNSAFAGVMRLYSPEREVHALFLRNYPDHREIDERSLADFLTALCVYDFIFLDSRSAWNEKELLRDSARSGSLDHVDLSWVNQLKELLPPEVADCISSDYNWAGIGEKQSCSRAFDIFNSAKKVDLLLQQGEEIPRVYYADDYQYRPEFDRLNMNHGYALNLSELAQAMFLHRGLYLQSIAHASGLVYVPYHIRGRMLSQLPPMTWALSRAAKGEDSSILRTDDRPFFIDSLTTLNEYYYSLVQAATWTTYETGIPFIGAAILAASKGDPHYAVELAMQYRREGSLMKSFQTLHSALQAGNKPAFDSLLKTFRSELEAAAQHFGVETGRTKQKIFYNLATCWLPEKIQKALEAAVGLLRPNVDHTLYEYSSRLITKSPIQMLFVDHIAALRSTYSG
jgi:hypothetical protein